jgi:hypothetical protein
MPTKLDEDWRPAPTSKPLAKNNLAIVDLRFFSFVSGGLFF